MSFSGVENQWNRQWLARLTVRLAACSIFPVINWPRPAANVSGMAGRAARRDAVYRFWPTIGDIPDALLARIMACRPLVYSIVRRLRLPPNVLLYPQR